MSHYKSREKSIISVLVGIICLLIFVIVFFFNNQSLQKNGWSDGGFDTEQDFVRVIDVGQGDSILIYSNGYSALIDTGLPEAANAVCKELDACGIKQIDILLLTHLDNDHTGSVDRITELYKVQNLILPELSVESEGLGTAELAINRIAKSGGNVCQAAQGMHAQIGEFEITVLANFSNMQSENNRSIVTCAKIADKKFLLTGDIESKAEKELLKENLNLKADVLKVGHHGSSSSSTQDFLKAVRPRYAAISVGADNMYGHPHNEVLAAFEKIGSKIFRTDLNGNITFYVKGGKIVPDLEY